MFLFSWLKANLSCLDSHTTNARVTSSHSRRSSSGSSRNLLRRNDCVTSQTEICVGDKCVRWGFAFYFCASWHAFLSHSLLHVCNPRGLWTSTLLSIVPTSPAHDSMSLSSTLRKRLELKVTWPELCARFLKWLEVYRKFSESWQATEHVSRVIRYPGVFLTVFWRHSCCRYIGSFKFTTIEISKPAILLFVTFKDQPSETLANHCFQMQMATWLLVTLEWHWMPRQIYIHADMWRAKYMTLQIQPSCALFGNPLG